RPLPQRAFSQGIVAIPPAHFRDSRDRQFPLRIPVGGRPVLPAAILDRKHRSEWSVRAVLLLRIPVISPRLVATIGSLRHSLAPVPSSLLAKGSLGVLRICGPAFGTAHVRPDGPWIARAVRDLEDP